MSIEIREPNSEALRRLEPPKTSTRRAIVLPATWYARGKRTIELTCAVVLSIPLVPVIFLLALLVRLTSRGPAFYSQTRLGKNGIAFTIYKLRTMTHNCERKSGAQWCKPGDPRVTWLGRLLRRLHLDELPQLWNVLRGDMSLVGPRPERPEFVPALEQAIPNYRDRLMVRPGVTGLAQIQLPADTDLNSVRRKLKYDRYYVSRHGLWLDVRIVICTACNLLGIPHWMTGRFLRVPGSNAVEADDRTAEQKRSENRSDNVPFDSPTESDLCLDTLEHSSLDD